MHHIKSVLKIHFNNKLSWFITLWGFVLPPAFIVNLAIAAFVEDPIYAGTIAYAYISMFIMGIVIPSDTLPLALGLNIRRTDYFLGTIAMLIMVSLASALLLLFLAIVEVSPLVKNWGTDLHFFHLSYLDNESWIGQFWIILSGITHLFLAGFVITSIYFRFHRTGLYVFFIVLLFFLSSGGLSLIYLGWWSPVFTWITQYSVSEIALGLFPVTITYGFLSYVLLRKATI